MKWGLANEITVNIALERVTLSDTDTAPLVLAPVLYIDIDSPRLRIVSIGEAPTVGKPARRVDLFGSDGPPAGISKLDCLAAFFTAALKKIMEGRLFRIRPDVTVHGVEVLSRAWGGYERDLLSSALRSAGAKRIRWPDDPQA
jgi:hypothetical protein